MIFNTFLYVSCLWHTFAVTVGLYIMGLSECIDTFIAIVKLLTERSTCINVIQTLNFL